MGLWLGGSGKVMSGFWTAIQVYRTGGREDRYIRGKGEVGGKGLHTHI